MQYWSFLELSPEIATHIVITLSRLVVFVGLSLWSSLSLQLGNNQPPVSLLALGYTSNCWFKTVLSDFIAWSAGSGGRHSGSKLVPDICQMRGQVLAVYCSKLVFLLLR